jgi:pilus assembly protein CpaE
MFKIAVISPNKARMEEIRSILQSTGVPRQILLLGDGLKQLTPATDKEFLDLIVIDRLNDGADDLATLEQLCLLYPGMAIIFLCENASPEFLIGAIRLGVKDVLPLNADALLAAVVRIEGKSKQVVTPHKMGKVIVVMASKGGSGATFLACNLGYILASEYQVKVALLDLNLQFGDATLFLSDQVPPNTLDDVANNISRLDASFLASSMVHVLPNYSILAAPEDAEHAEDVEPEHIEALITLSKSQYDYIIIDAGRMLNATNLKALDQADMIFLVLQQTLPFIRDSRRLIQTLQSLGYIKEKINLIVNRYEKRADINLEDVEATLGMPVFKTIPNSYESVSASVNQGVPIQKIAKHDSVTKSLEEWSGMLIYGPEHKKNNWLTDFMKRA